MAANTLAPPVPSLSEAMSLIMSNKWVHVLHKEEFQVHVPSHCSNMIENRNAHVCYFHAPLEKNSKSRFNSLWPSDIIWSWFSSTLTWITACCLVAPSHNLNQCLLIVNWTQYGQVSTIFKIKAYWPSFKNMHLEILPVNYEPYCSGLNELTHCGLVTPYGILRLGHHWFR